MGHIDCAAGTHKWCEETWKLRSEGLITVNQVSRSKSKECFKLWEHYTARPGGESVPDKFTGT